MGVISVLHVLSWAVVSVTEPERESAARTAGTRTHSVVALIRLEEVRHGLHILHLYVLPPLKLGALGSKTSKHDLVWFFLLPYGPLCIRFGIGLLCFGGCFLMTTELCQSKYRARITGWTRVGDIRVEQALYILWHNLVGSRRFEESFVSGHRNGRREQNPWRLRHTGT